MITISATLHCVECPSKAHNTQLIIRSDGQYEVVPDSLDGWLVNYADEAPFPLTGDKHFGDMNAIGGGVSIPGAAPVVTCSDDCRKIRDARKRLERSKISEPDQPMAAQVKFPTAKRTTIYKGGPGRPGSFPKVGSKSRE